MQRLEGVCYCAVTLAASLGLRSEFPNTGLVYTVAITQGAHGNLGPSDVYEVFSAKQTSIMFILGMLSKD